MEYVYYDSIHDSSLKSEIAFIEFIGYHLDDCKLGNNWQILDENNREVGSLTIHDDIYHTIINSDKIKYDEEGKLNDIDFKTFNYELNDKYHVKQRVVKRLGSCRHIDIVGDNISVHVCLSTDGCGYLELSYRITEKGYERYQNMEYYYNKNYYDNIEDNSGHYDYYEHVKSDILGIDDIYSFSASTLLFNKSGPLEGRTYTKSHGITTKSESFKFNESAEELAINHQKGIELFNEIRKVVNEIIPHQGDVIDDLFDEETIHRFSLGTFFPNYRENKEKTK